MVNGGDGAQQSAIIEQLIRLEAGVAALNQQVTDNHNLLLEAIRQMNELLDETNRLIDETNRLIDETNQATNHLLDETNRLIDETNQATNTRLDNQLGELRREFRSEFNKLTYLILGTGAAIIAAVVATQLFT